MSWHILLLWPLGRVALHFSAPISLPRACPHHCVITNFSHPLHSNLNKVWTVWSLPLSNTLYIIWETCTSESVIEEMRGDEASIKPEHVVPLSKGTLSLGPFSPFYTHTHWEKKRKNTQTRERRFMRFEVKGNRQISKNDYVQHPFILIVFEASFHLIFAVILWNTIKVPIIKKKNRVLKCRKVR